MPKRNDPLPPDGLGAAGTAFWKKIVKDYELEPADLVRLEVACDCLDRIRESRGKQDRASVSVWRDAAKIYLSTTRAMGIDGAQTE